MLDGAPIEDPFSILSASIEHPLQSCDNLVGNREESGGKMKNERRRMKDERMKKEKARHSRIDRLPNRVRDNKHSLSSGGW